MKLIIDIPEKNFIKDDLIHFFGCYSTKLDEVIKNGIPLDDLKAEIEKIKTDTMYKYVGDFRYGVDTVIEIIDKYKTENEDKR